MDVDDDLLEAGKVRQTGVQKPHLLLVERSHHLRLDALP
jgi:hypothetical protein